MLDAAITWIEANADLLGGIGTICAATMFLFTNGRTLVQRVAPGSKAITVTPDAGDAAFIDAPPPSPDYGDRTAIAVVPFKELGSLPEHFVEGLLEDLVADLKKAGFATPTKSAMARAAAQGSESHTLARNLGVAYVLEGSVRCQEDSFRLALQLTDASGAVEWSDRFNMKGDDVMAMQDAMAKRACDAITDHLEPVSTTEASLTAAMGAPRFTTQTEALQAGTSAKSRMIAFILCALFGVLGVHRFYIGRWFTGLLYIFTGGLFVVGWVIDTLLLLFGGLTDRHGRRIRRWLPEEGPVN